MASASVPTPAPPPRLRLLGPPQFETDGAPPLALPCERRTQLVAWLALKRGWVGRPELASLLWPEQADRHAFANLRKIVHRLQGTPWGSGLQSQGQALRFVAATDVAEFDAALADERLDAALALYRGDLLAGFDDDANPAWAERLRFERERLRSAWRGAALARLQQGTLAPTAAAELAARLVAADPLDEAALAAQMQALARSGQVGQARAAYHAYAERLRSELGIAPGAALRAQHDRLEHDAGDATPSAATAAGTDGFIGRAAELRRIGELLAQPDCAVLVLIGPGGIGKTTLARRALLTLAPGHADGAALVALENVPTTAELGHQLAAALGLQLEGKAAALDEVRRALAGRRMLLVLDNFEHLAADAAWLDGWAQTCPRVKLIVTSRVRPAAHSVWTLPVDGLPCPEADDQDRIEAFDAARLFVRAAQRVSPSLVPAAEAAAIVDICRQLQGLPLALELAAGFTRVLSCEAIAGELREGTELLRAIDPSRPARQASMETVFEHSWQHLAGAERAALARLSVFRGGFTAAAAREVGGVSLPVLAALADKSLLYREGARCQLHPLVQQLARQRLDGGIADGPEWMRTAAAHSRHFLRWLVEMRPGIRHAERRTMLEADAEFDNLRAAWRFAARHGPAELLVQATYCLMTYADHRGRRSEALALLRGALDGAPARGDERLDAALRASIAQLEVRLDRYAEGEALALRALASAERTSDLTLRQQCTSILGTATARQGRLDDARRWFERALHLATEAADVTHRAATLDNLALIERIRGRLDESLALYHQGLRLHREAADAGGEAQCLNNLGVVHVLRGEHAAARGLLHEARGLCERHGLASTRSMVEVNLANIALFDGDGATARAHAERALEISLDNRQPGCATDARLVLCSVAIAFGELEQAQAQLRDALEAALAIGRAPLLVQAVRCFAELIAARGETAAAARAMAFALAQRTGLVGRERQHAEQLLRRWGAAPEALPHWPGPALEPLAERLLAEAGLGFAPLIGELRSAA